MIVRKPPLFRSLIAGTGITLLLAAPVTAGANSIMVCDVDGDGVVDVNDIDAIFDFRGENAVDIDDPMDANGDGLITVNDGRICVLRCDLVDCEEPPAGGGS